MTRQKEPNMQTLQPLLTIIAVLAILSTGCQARETYEGKDVFQLARQELAAGPGDSDAAVILSRALDQAKTVEADAGRKVLVDALNQAREAREFTIAEEAPLPEGWPRPSLPGLVRLKKYPAVRAAWARQRENRNSQFRVLFRHIQNRDVAMTAPVVMEYDRQATSDASHLNETEAMAFLYRRPGQDQAGEFGKVEVVNDPPMKVISVGMKGSYSNDRFRKGLDQLQQWLRDNPSYQAAGPPRVLAYHSPFMLWWRKYSEVQIPVRAANDKPDRREGEGASG